jgi:hypothetical protein
MTRRLRVGLLLTAIAGLTATVDVPPSSASCAAALLVDGRVLLGQGGRVFEDPPPLAGRVDVVVPACNDTNLVPPEPDRPGKARAILGTPPQLAVRGNDRAWYLDDQRLWGLDGHPLQQALFGDDLAWPAQRGACRPRTIGLTRLYPSRGPHGSLLLGRYRGQDIRVEVQRNTGVTGRSSFGYPEVGKSAVVSGSLCATYARERFRRMRAERIRLK